MSVPDIATETDMTARNVYRLLHSAGILPNAQEQAL